MRRTVVLAMAICSARFSTSADRESVKPWPWSRLDWQIASSERECHIGLVLKGHTAINLFSDESSDESLKRDFATPGPNWFWLCGGPKTISDFDLAVSVGRLFGEGKESYIVANDSFREGVGWGIQPRPVPYSWPDGYGFEIGRDSFAITKRLQGRETFIAPWTRSSAIKAGPFPFRPRKGDLNRLRVKKTGAQHTLWINGVQVLQFTDTDLPTGQVSLKTYDDGGATVHRFHLFSITYSQAAGSE